MISINWKRGFPQLIKLFALVMKLVENCAQARIIMRFIITSARNIGKLRGVLSGHGSVGRFMNRSKVATEKCSGRPIVCQKTKARMDRLEIMDRRVSTQQMKL